MKQILTLCLFLCSLSLLAQEKTTEETVNDYFRTYTVKGYRPHNPMRADSVSVNDTLHTVDVHANEPFCSQPFTPERVKQIYNALKRQLPAPCNTYHLSIYSPKGELIEDLIPNFLRERRMQDLTSLWGETDYKGAPWVSNLSLPYHVTAGLQNRHLFIWPSHGRYYKAGAWRWQRPHLYCTTEDLFTQSIVFPFLFPMLEKAGAVVYSPRERDYQTAEAVVDNDTPQRQGAYSETEQTDAAWTSSDAQQGFGSPSGLLTDSVQPFLVGTYRYTNAVNRRNRLAQAIWTPRIPRTGRYAVYVSYSSRAGSIPDARYTVYHKGGRTSFQVNQQMGGGTWVYLGTFEFDEGENQAGRVVLTNQSNYRGIVSADGVRFGGGVGQTERGAAGTSGLPRYLEAARYYAQWAGVPDTLYNTTGGTDDYSDDLRVRSNMLNWLAGGSVFYPGQNGRHVPLELSLALHSDAGVRSDRNIYGSLSISTSWNGKGEHHYGSGLARRAAADLSNLLLSQVTTDLSARYQISWTRREHWDRNYAETRMPDVPAAILEMLSHQNFWDMRYGHDPTFKFQLARSIYKAVLRYVYYMHELKNPVVQPLPPACFAAQLTSDGQSVKLSWQPQTDSLEATARPTGYILYTRTDGDFDNGQPLGNVLETSVPLTQGKRYAFKITAVNAGGESFPSEVLAAYNAGKNSRRVLIVNAFTRLSGPAQVIHGDSLGFDLDADMGVPYLATNAFAGRQRDFIHHTADYNTGSDLTGQTFAGNTFDFPAEHGAAIATAPGWSYCSVSQAAFMQSKFSLSPYTVIDYLGGLQADKPYNLQTYKLFPAAARAKIKDYLSRGGSLLVSGSFLGSDNQSAAEQTFLKETLKCRYDGTAHADTTGYVRGLNLEIPLFRFPTATHYGAQSPDALWPATGCNAFTAFAYGGGQSAGVAYSGKDYRVIALGFPFECIRSAVQQAQAMQALLRFLAD